MAWYLRKSLRLGPFLRFNLSKSGVGVSAGVKGARVGVDARGRSYVHAGRGGLYFRKFLASPRPTSNEEPGPTSNEEQLPPALRPVLPIVVTLAGILLAFLLLLQFQRDTCTAVNVFLEFTSSRRVCEPTHPGLFSGYFWPIFGLASVLAFWAILWAARRDARVRAWLDLRAEQTEPHRPPMTRDDLRAAMEPPMPVIVERRRRDNEDV